MSHPNGQSGWLREPRDFASPRRGGFAFSSVPCRTTHRYVTKSTPSTGALQGQGEDFLRNPLTSRADRGLISAPWRACPVVGQPMTNLNSPMTPVDRPRPAAPAPPNGGHLSPLQSPRAELLVRRLFQRFRWFSAHSPLFFYGGRRPRRSMRHRCHAPRCHQHTAARHCRAHRRGGPDGRERVPCPGRSRTSRKRGTSRIALPPIREPRGRKDAAQASSRAVGRDPDCRGRLAVKLHRLLGGRR